MSSHSTKTTVIILTVLVLQLGALFAGSAFILARIDGLEQARRNREEAFSDELRGNAETIEAVIRTLHSTADQNNELREFLGLPRTRPTALDELTQRSSEGTSPAHPLANAVKQLIQHERNEQSRHLLVTAAAEPGFQDALTALNLSYRELEDTQAELSRNGVQYFRITAHPSELLIRPADGGTQSFRGSDSRLVDFLQRTVPRIEDHLRALQQLQAEFEQLPEVPELKAVLDQRRITVNIRRNDGRSELEFRNNYGETIHTLRFVPSDGKVRGVGGTTLSLSELKAQLPEFIRQLDTRPHVVREMNRSRDKLVELLSQPELVAQLAESGARIETAPRESQRHYMFDVINTRTGQLIGAIGLHRDDASLRLFDAEDVPIMPLPDLEDHILSSSSAAPRNLPDISVSEGARTFLLLGIHERIADVVMVAHANPSAQRITILSIPRDLYYRGRRVNAVYQIYGVKRLMRELQEITGLRIDDYVMVDMYAFIDVVDTLGGVTIELEEPLRDPSYVVRDEGRWSTLSYEAGTQDLSGIEALRVARSRGTSSDFERSMRQQQILEGVLLGVRTMSVNQLQQTARTVFRHIDSSLSPIAAVNYLLRYKDYEFERRDGLDTSNVLYHTYSNLYFQGKAPDAEVDASFDKGAWILLPINDDWSEVRRYVQSIITGDRS